MCRPVQRRFGISETQIAVIREWAERTRYLASLRLFGSRLKGCARIDSDLDIAIDAADEHYKRWEGELQELTGLGQPYGTTRPTRCESIATSSACWSFSGLRGLDKRGT